MNATENINGEYKVVGSTCIQDFTGNQTAASVASYFEMVASLSDFSDLESSGRVADRFDLMSYLGWVAADIRVSGWLSRTAARNLNATATADSAYGAMEMKAAGKEVKFEYIPTETDHARAQAAFEYLMVFIDAEAEKGELNDYLHNLSVVGRMGTVNFKGAGLVASIIPTAEREMGKEIERRKFVNLKETSKFFGGEEKSKFVVQATILSLKELETQWGLTTLVKFVTVDGNVGTWFASGALDDKEWDTEDLVWLAGSIKKHEIYQDLHQTIVTRVSMVTQAWVDGEAAKAAKKAQRAAKKAAKLVAVTP
jgi:hypothetical protein